MTVAAVILAASPESALADADGVARVRRLADVAWAGGAVPIVVNAPDPDGRVAAALAGAPVTQVSPAPTEAGPVGQIVLAIDAATAEVRDTDAALVWPARLAWVDAETITSLIETHGMHPGFVLRPTYDGEAGWPVLIPGNEVGRMRGLRPDRMPDDLIQDLLAEGAVELRVDLGDPGTVHDADTPRADLPPFLGPAAPASGHHEWGATAGETPDDVPLEGPALAPFGQAADDEPLATDDALPAGEGAATNRRSDDALRREP
jgi:CTP:molybdopterin cytidylyltransferase MocA